MNRQTGKNNIHHNWPTAWQGRDAHMLEECSDQGQTRASQHCLPEGKRSGERKRPVFQPWRSGRICLSRPPLVLLRRHLWRKTAEKQHVVCMGLSKQCIAILSGDWKLSTVCPRLSLKQFWSSGTQAVPNLGRQNVKPLLSPLFCPSDD